MKKKSFKKINEIDGSKNKKNKRITHVQSKINICLFDENYLKPISFG